MRKLSISIRCLFITVALAVSVSAQQPFNKGEFEGRRGRLFEKIGDGVAVIFAASGQHYPVKFRQSPDFYYLTGIEEPGSVLIVNGARKSSFVFVPKRSRSKAAAEGPGVREMEKPTEFYGINVLPLENFYTISGRTMSGAGKM